MASLQTEVIRRDGLYWKRYVVINKFSSRSDVRVLKGIRGHEEVSGDMKVSSGDMRTCH